MKQYQVTVQGIEPYALFTLLDAIKEEAEKLGASFLLPTVETVTVTLEQSQDNTEFSQALQAALEKRFIYAGVQPEEGRHE